VQRTNPWKRIAPHQIFLARRLRLGKRVPTVQAAMHQKLGREITRLAPLQAAIRQIHPKLSYVTVTRTTKLVNADSAKTTVLCFLQGVGR